MAQSAALPRAEEPRLAAGALGLGAQLFQAITHMAPAAGIVFSVQYMASQGGASHTLAYILATLACLFSALCLKELVRKVRSAGGYFVIHSVALGHGAGFTTSWLWFLYDPVIVGASCLLFPAILTDYLRRYAGIELPWQIFSFVMAAVLFVVTFVGVRQAAKVSMVLGTIETGVFALFGIILIIKAGGNQPLISLSPAASPHGWGGVAFAMVFGILSFLGFESGVPMAEESRNARRNVILGLMISTIGIGLFYIVMSYATVAGWAGFPAEGSTTINFSQFSQDDAVAFSKEFSSADVPFYPLAARAFGTFGPLIMLLLLTNSMFAVGVAAMNATTRVGFSLGRAGIFPRAFSHINSRTQTPDVAIGFTAVLGVALAFIFGMVIGPDPLTAFGLLGLLATVGAIIVYIMTHLSCFLLYYRQYRDEFKVVDHVVWPVVATVFMIPPLIASLFPRTLDVIGMGFDNAYPISLGLPIAVVWAILGVVFYFYLKVRKPEALVNLATEMARVQLVGEADDAGSRAVRAT